METDFRKSVFILRSHAGESRSNRSLTGEASIVGASPVSNQKEYKMTEKKLRTLSTPFGDITYELERKRIKRLNLRIRRDGTVHLSIPWSTSYAYADKFVSENAAFVFNAKKRIAQIVGFSSERTFFLGKPLKIETMPSQKAGGKLDGEVLTLLLPVKDGNDDKEELIKGSLEIWQREQAKELLPKALELAYNRFLAAGLKVPYPALSMRVMTSRWGSCAAYKNKITLNIKLVEKPFICIEQVACHELAHFIVQNHSADFYAVLDKVMKEHREVNKLLKANNAPF